MVANSMVFSRFRYWTYTHMENAEVKKAVEEDVQALIWGKDVYFDSDEMGHEKAKRYVKYNAQFNPRREGGIGLLHWDSHAKAIRAQALFHYANGWDLGWKWVLDHWFARYQEGRGAIFSTISTRDLISSPLDGHASKLPRFWKRALRDLRELKLEPVRPGEYTSADEARAEPPWTSPRITLTNRDFGDSWRTELEFNRVQDMIDPDTGCLYDDEMIEQYVRGAFELEGEHICTYSHTDLSGFTRYKYTPIDKMVQQWRTFAKDVGQRTLDTAAGRQATPPAIYSPTAQKLMNNMGWRPGEPLGTRGDGITEPIPVQKSFSRASSRALPCQQEHTGLYLGRFVRASGSEDKRPVAPPSPSPSKRKRIIYYGLETSPKVIEYGLKGERNGQEVLEIMTSVGRGNMVRTGEVKPVRHSELREAVTWDGAPSGIAEASFPHPHGWTIVGAPAGTTLERTSVRALTAIYRLQIDERPSCEKAWNKVFGTELDWKAIWRRFSNPLLTPRDYKNYYRFLHRSMRTRDLFPREGDEGNACRMCRAEGERFSHIPQCYSVLQIFERFTSFARSLVPTLQTSQELICFGTHGGQPLPGGLSAFHVIIWKFIIIDFTQADIHGTKFEPDRVWVAATRRLRSRLMAHEANMIRKARAHRSRGWKPPTIGAPNLQAGPLLEYRHDECEGPWGCDLTCTPAQHLTGLYDELQIL